jgi:Fanconi anemia group J protein
LTSGTLYPFDSFKSELGINFQNVLEASHVINLQRQLFAGIVTHDKDKVQYQITRATSDSYTFQGIDLVSHN